MNMGTFDMEGGEPITAYMKKPRCKICGGNIRSPIHDLPFGELGTHPYEAALPASTPEDKK